jgi:hypothetical protein
MTRSSLSVAERKYLGGPRMDINRLEQHPLGIVQPGLMRDLGDNRRKQVWAAILILDSAPAGSPVGDILDVSAPARDFV